MFIRTSRSKPVACTAILLFFILIFNTSYLNSGKVVSQEADRVFEQGQEAYKDGDYVKAIERFSQVLVLTKDKGMLEDTYFYLSLCNFHMNELTSAREWIKRVVEMNPGRRVSSIYPQEYRELYEQVKREVSVSLERKTSPPKEDTAGQDEKKTPERPQVVVVPSESRGGGGGSVILYLLLGAALAGGAAYFLLSKKDEGGNGGNGGSGEEQEGSVQVNSTPTGATIYLDGVNTGTKTNGTLTGVDPGSHTIKLTKDAYVDYSTSVSVSAGQTATVNATLKKHTLTLTSPGEDSVWYMGQKAEIKWKTGDSSASEGFLGLGDRFNRLLKGGNPLAQLKRMRLFRFSAQAQGRAAQQASIRTGGGVRVQALKSEKSMGFKGTGKDISGVHEEIPGTPDSVPGTAGIHTFSPAMATGKGLGKGSLDKTGIQGLESVKIELLQAGEVVRTIASSADNDGVYTWEVPRGLDKASNYRIKIECVSESSVNDLTEKFEITSVGDIRVKSQPTGAAVYLDGEDTGKKSNCLLPDITTGTHTVVLIKEGYEDYVKTFWVKANEVNVVDADLSKHSITVTSPAAGDEWARGADVDILWNSDAAAEAIRKLNEANSTASADLDLQAQDGKQGEIKPQVLTEVKIDLYQGGTKVKTIVNRTDNDGAYSWTVPNNTSLGSNYKVRIACTADSRVFGESGLFSVTGFGSIRVTSTPSNADVYLDGTDTGKTTPCTLKNVSPGDHAIKVSKEGYADYQETVTVEENKTVNVSAVLEELELKIISPEKYDIWGKGKTIKVEWETESTASGLRVSSSHPAGNADALNKEDDSTGDTAAGQVKIELYKGLTKVATLTDGTANDGNFWWKVSKEKEISGENFTLKISIKGQPDIYDESEVFTITDMNYEHVLTIGSGPGSGDTQFNCPYAIGLDNSLPVHLYIADMSNHRIVKYTWTGSFVKKWGSYGNGADQFNGPTGVAVDYWGDQKVFVTDISNNRISIWTKNGNHVTNWGSGPGNGTNEFHGPAEVTISKDSKLYVTDIYNHRVKKTGLYGWVQNIWGSIGTSINQFNSPMGIDIDLLGNLYVADINNHRIQKFDANGNYKLNWGNSGEENGQFKQPYAVATDIFGFVYVADTVNHRIQKFTSLGKFIIKWGSEGSAEGEFKSPRGIAVDGYGNVYVSDIENHKIQKFRITYD